ncbi:MAG: phage virion morphogenesis protein [Gallionella sp.]|nr:phage virion morphogenesis protein [Gallionella sp.]MDD4946468.1 phage virion morphogenesis protein [Gallionella sp.]
MISIEITNQPVIDALNKLIRSSQDMHPIMDAIGMTMESRVSDRFETKTDPSGKAWAPWKPSTEKSYPKDGNRKLLDRGPLPGMLASLSYQVDGDSVFDGFGQPYAEWHERGTGKMERRGLLTADPVSGILGTGDEDAIYKVLSAALR